MSTTTYYASLNKILFDRNNIPIRILVKEWYGRYLNDLKFNV